jgi:hypothetical protein
MAFPRTVLWTVGAIVAFVLVLRGGLALTQELQKEEDKLARLALSLPEEEKKAWQSGFMTRLIEYRQQPTRPTVYVPANALPIEEAIPRKQIPHLFDVHSLLFPHPGRPVSEADVQKMLTKAQKPMATVTALMAQDRPIRWESLWAESFVRLFLLRARQQKVAEVALQDTQHALRIMAEAPLEEHLMVVSTLRILRKIARENRTNDAMLTEVERQAGELPRVPRRLSSEYMRFVQLSLPADWQSKRKYVAEGQQMLDVNPYFRTLDYLNYELARRAEPAARRALALRYHRQMDELLRTTSSRQWLSRWKEIRRLEEQIKKQTPQGGWVAPYYFGNALIGRMLQELRWGQTVTLTALYRYKNEHGEYPTDLGQLPIGTPIIDPITGKPFHWRRDDRRGWLLYSVGLDEKDDGGKQGDQLTDTRDIVVEVETAMQP